MAEPPKISGADKVSGPLCPICKKPYNEHTWIQKQECNRCMKLKEREEVWEEEKRSLK